MRGHTCTADCGWENVHTCFEYIQVVNSMSILCLWYIQLTFDWDLKRVP